MSAKHLIAYALILLIVSACLLAARAALRRRTRERRGHGIRVDLVSRDRKG